MLLKGVCTQEKHIYNLLNLSSVNFKNMLQFAMYFDHL